jgi:hypothetical protein
MKLGIYLNDHLAGAVLGGELARRALGNNREGPLSDFLRSLHGDITEDRETLIRLMDRLGLARNPFKMTLGWASEKVGRLKPNGRFLAYSRLSRLEELEALAVGIEAKRSMWVLLAALEEADDRLKGFDFPTLIKRAEAQREELERHRLAAGVEALG